MQAEISIVVPVYRSQATLETFTSRMIAVMNREAIEYEIIFVDDGSPDSSWEVLERLQSQHSARISVIQLMRNFGQHNALMCGLREARGDLIVTMDDDLQNPPEEIPKLINAIEQREMDLVYGTYASKHQSVGRYVGSRVIHAFFRLVFQTSIEITSFRILRRELLKSIVNYDLNYTFIDGLLAWNTQRVGAVEVDYHPRVQGHSGYSLGKLLTLAFNLFTNFSLLPLQLVSVVGLLAAAAGLLGGAVYMVLFLLAEISVPGYASTIIAVLVLGGIQLLSLGIIGEYLGRVHLNINRKPQYTIREAYGRCSHASEATPERDDAPARWTAPAVSPGPKGAS